MEGTKRQITTRRRCIRLMSRLRRRTSIRRGILVLFLNSSIISSSSSSIPMEEGSGTAKARARVRVGGGMDIRFTIKPRRGRGGGSSRFSSFFFLYFFCRLF